MKCQLTNYCKKYPGGCNRFCEGYVLIDILYKQSGIPKKYQFPKELTVESIDSKVYQRVANILSSVVSWVNEGNSLMLFGEGKGTGKTTLACSIANKYIRETIQGNRFEANVYFIKTPKFLEQLRQQYDNKSTAVDDLVKRVLTVPLLIIDDIGAEKSTPWVRERLLSVIDERYSNELSTIYTSNCSIAQISETLQDRIADRLNDCEKLHFRGCSKRGVNFGGK